MTARDLTSEDTEQIAAYLDQTMSQSEREAFARRLDVEEALYEVFVDTVRFREQASLSTKVVKHPRAQRSFRRFSGIAAILLLGVATPFVLRNRSVESFSEALVASGELDSNLEDAWYEHAWTSLRGGWHTTDESRSAFRLGVYTIDLEIAVRTGRYQQAELLADRMRDLAVDVDYLEPLEASYRAIQLELKEGSATEEILSLVRLGEVTLMESLQESLAFYELGRWAETGRLAAKSRNEGLLRGRPFRGALDQFTRRKQTEVDIENLRQITGLLEEVHREVDWTSLEAAFSAIIGSS